MVIADMRGCAPVALRALEPKSSPFTVKPFSREQLVYSTLVLPDVVLTDVNSSADVVVCALAACA